ncbi:MAG: SurA N-terminal domain-containing protein [Thermoanaerobaculia bacterium]|nr:SurA N-terminal domain-containing protein [Thermoanaerobaculia bacterium]
MLKILRDNLRYLSWILWLVIIVFIAFVFVDFGAARMGAGGTGAAATVGDSKVGYDEFQRQYRSLEERYRQAFGERFTPEMAQQLQLPLQALEQLVGQKILLQEAARLGLSASDAEVREAILAQSIFRDESGAFVGPEFYEQVLASEGYTVAAFERTVRDQILINKVSSILAQTLHVPDAEVERAYRDDAEKARVRYLQLPAARFAQQATVEPAEVEAHFAAHPEAFRLPRQRVVSYLLVDGARLRAQTQVSDEDLRRYYDQNQEEYRREEQVRARHILVQVGAGRTEEQARAEIDALRARIEGGADFAALARERSDDPGSQSRGGDLGFFGRGRMIKEFEDAAFSAEPGRLVGPLRTGFGFHLLEVLERRAAGLQPYEEVEPQIRARLLTERVDAAAEARARELSRRVREEKLATAEQLQGLADGEVVSGQTTPPFGEEDPVAGIGRGTPFTTAAFALAQGTVSDPVKIPRGWALLWLVEEREPRTPELAEVAPRVRLAVQQQKQGELARQELQRARGAMAGGKSLDEVAAELGVQAVESPAFGPRGDLPGLAGSAEVAAAAFTLEAGQVGGPFATGNGAVLFEVLERQHFDPARFAAEREQKRQELEGQAFEALVDSLIAQRKLELKVTYDRPLLEDLGLAGDAASGG